VCCPALPVERPRHRTRWLAWAFAIIALSEAQPSFAQRPSTVDVPDQPCDRCRLTAVRRTTLGGPQAPLTGLPSSVTRATSGKYLILTRRVEVRDSMVPVFDSGGRFERYLARRGQGPGELTAPIAILPTRGDSVLVLERGLARTYAASLRGFRDVRLQSPVGTVHSITRVTGDGLLAFTLLAGSLDSVFLGRGALVGHRGFGAPPSDPSPRGGLLARAESPPPDASLWLVQAIEASGYVAMKYDTLGNRTLALRRRPSWWFSGAGPAPVVVRLPDGAAPVGGPDTLPRPASRVVDALITDDGVLHVLTSHASTGWRSVRRESAFADQVYVSVIESIDTRTNRLVGRVEIAGYAVALLGASGVATYREDRDGFPYLDIWRLDLVRTMGQSD
jgi:hypothetical protein